MRRAALILAASLAAGPARACGLALALLVDVSGSVDPNEYRTQMAGLAEALRDGVVSEALVREEAALALIQWTGKSRQEVLIPWTRTPSFEAVDALADEIAGMPRRWRHFSTAIGEALELAERALADAPECDRRIVDISSDGRSNEGTPPTAARDRLVASGVTINALVITDSEDDLVAYFEREVIGGRDAFALEAESYRVYPERIREKLLRETARALSRGIPPSLRDFASGSGHDRRRPDHGKNP